MLEWGIHATDACGASFTGDGSSMTVARALGAAALLVLLAMGAGCRRADEPAVSEPQAPVPASAAEISPAQLAAIFDAASGAPASPGGYELPAPGEFSRDDPDWPTLVYLLGEAQLKRGDIARARDAFSDLVGWAAGSLAADGHDRWGGSGLAAVALWRWLEILDEHGGATEDFDRALRAAADLRTSRLFGGMVGSGLLPALPLLEEEIARRLTRVAGKAGRPEAMTLLLYFVSINSSGDLEAADEAIIEQMIESGSLTRERLDLFRYQRLLNRVTVQARKAEAAEQLGGLWRNSAAPRDVRAEAAYEWGNFHRLSRSLKREVVAALTEAYEFSDGRGPVAEKALFRRAMVQGSVDPRRMDLFHADMRRLLADHPRSRLADDALYQVATEQLFGPAPDPERAFASFAQLREFGGSNDWLDSAYFVAAIGHFDRGTESDLQAADRLLADYLARFPDGVFRPRSLFWRGRIAERSGDSDAAQRWFAQVVDEAPFDYYGLRSRLHSEFGAEARFLPLPPPESETFAGLQDAYRQSRVDDEITGRTPYHERLRSADESRLYARALAVVEGLGPKFRNRVDNIPLRQLDESHLVPAVALLLSLRQDALAALDAEPTRDNQLRLAGFSGRRVGDWPNAMLIVMGDTPASGTGSTLRLQADPRYLATSYPGMSDMPGLRTPLVEAAWPIDASRALTESLMYAVIRRESSYFPGAISPVGAIGLFQIMPATFRNRRDCWRWPDDAPAPTPEAYLFDPGRNIRFWACWIRTEFDPESRADVAPLIMAHNAGVGNLQEWRRSWRGRATETDLELQIESVRFRATQNFVRRVLTDTAIAEASGLFGDAAVGHGQRP